MFDQLIKSETLLIDQLHRHLGMLETWMTPVGRGYETSLGYLGGGEVRKLPPHKNGKEYAARECADIYICIPGWIGSLHSNVHRVLVPEASR
jgi:hypothetical protein